MDTAITWCSWHHLFPSSGINTEVRILAEGKLLKLKLINKYNQQTWQHLFSSHTSFMLLTLQGCQWHISWVCSNINNYIKHFAFTITCIWQHCCSRQRPWACLLHDFHPYSWAQGGYNGDDQVAVFRYTKHPAMQFKQQWYTWTARNKAGNRNIGIKNIFLKPLFLN